MITRYRGDTQRLKISLTKNNAALDLSLLNKVELGIDKGTSGVIVIECIKDDDDATGIIYVPFSVDDLDKVGSFPFDIQVTWLDLTKTTLLVDKFKVINDVNKT